MISFVEKAIKVHGDKYDYSLVNYVDSKTKVKIVCNEHGIFEQTPSNHIQGSKCKWCSIDLRKSIEHHLHNLYLKVIMCIKVSIIIH